MQLISTLLLLLISNISLAIDNQLSQHPSPYLAMHGKDPVAWQEWNSETVAMAKKQQRLLFVSSGYFSCHWCHVMQKESYQDPAIARLINENFVPVKVDRELNPSLDAYLIRFLENTQGYSGWPLNVFITPDGHPLIGLVYLPPEDFSQLLKKLSHFWKQERQQLSMDAAKAAKELAQLKQPPQPYRPSSTDQKNYRQVFLQQLWQQANTLQGGFGEQNKFPMVPQLYAILEHLQIDSDDELKQFLFLTLDQMASQGLRDQVGGGFFRYTTDPDWKTPHFEKMLYDNALLASLYLDVGKTYKRQDYITIGLNTVDFMLDSMWHEKGGFIASLSAVDEHNVEGGYYLWSKPQLTSILSTKQYKLISDYWGLDKPPVLDAGYHPAAALSSQQVAKKNGLTNRQTAAVLDSAIQRLQQQRSKRGLPVDNKRLTAWNALAISALARAYAISKNDKYLDAAQQTYRYITTQHWDGKQLYRSYGDKGPLGKAGLEDYVLLAQSMRDWKGLHHDLYNQPLISKLVEQSWERFYAEEGFQRSEQMLLEYGNRETLISDDVLPSSSAVLIKLSYQLSKEGSQEGLQKKAQHALMLTHNTLLAEPFWHASHLSLIENMISTP